MRSLMRTRAFPALILCAAAAALASCGETNLMRDAAIATGIATPPKEAPEFVRQSRPAQLDYMPVGVSAPPREATYKSKAAVTAAEAELDTLRTGNAAKGAEARQAGATPAPVAAPPR
jgi:hypothetical protein